MLKWKQNDDSIRNKEGNNMDNTQHTTEDNGVCSYSWSCDICPYEDTYNCEMYINKNKIDQ